MSKLWREFLVGCKYLVLNRQGKVKESECFVICDRDPCADAALLAYVSKAIELGLDGEYAESVDAMRLRFKDALALKGAGDPDAGPRSGLVDIDDPTVIAAMLSPGTSYRLSRKA